MLMRFSGVVAVLGPGDPLAGVFFGGGFTHRKHAYTRQEKQHTWAYAAGRRLQGWFNASS